MHRPSKGFIISGVGSFIMGIATLAIGWLLPMTSIRLPPEVAQVWLWVSIAFGFIGLVLMLYGALRRPRGKANPKLESVQILKTENLRFGLEILVDNTNSGKDIWVTKILLGGRVAQSQVGRSPFLKQVIFRVTMDCALRGGFGIITGQAAMMEQIGHIICKVLINILMGHLKRFGSLVSTSNQFLNYPLVKNYQSCSFLSLQPRRL